MSFDEEYGRLQSEDRPLSYGGHCDPLVISPINIDDPYHDVHLLDISNNKKWMAYVTYTITDFPSTRCIAITRRRFTAMDQETKTERLGFGGDHVLNADMYHSSFDITDYVKSNDCANSKFLSISNDGKYVALSFYEKDYGSEYISRRRYINPYCIIFDMDRDLSYVDKIRCQGRAVFLNYKEDYRLAIINRNHIEIYANFFNLKIVACTLDLSCFRSNGRRVCSTISKQWSYINSASWASLSYHMFDHDNIIDAEDIIMFTRHIRHNILITPFDDHGVVRIWSILDECARFSSFPATCQHIMALSKCYSYAAAYIENSRSINIYSIKSGLRAYRLESSEKSNAQNFKVSHIRFCYEARYVAMSRLENDNEVVFEVWHLESERSIYRTTAKIVKQEGTKDMIAALKRVEPFVTRDLKNNEKCLKGYYTSYPNGKMTIMCVELKIDESPEGDNVNWITGTDPQFKSRFEIENGLSEFKYIKCGYIKIGHKKYLIRFGKCTVQLWHAVSNGSLITEDDELLYIRAYNGPNYGLEYSFRETWGIHDFDSIRYIGGDLPGRLIVNIRMLYKTNSYHTEEIFLPLPPLDDTISERKFEYHKLESACQALHYFHNENPEKLYTNPNWNIIYEKTTRIISSCIYDINCDCSFFLTIAGSRMLAMLASFEDGRKVIKSILASRAPISIFSYFRSHFEINKNNPTGSHRYYYSSMPQDIHSYQPKLNNSNESDMPAIAAGELSYRSSRFKLYCRKSFDTTEIARNENALTVLIDELNLDLYNLLYNRIILDSKKVGLNCLSSLTDTLQYLEKGKNHNFLLSSSAKLAYLEVNDHTLGILSYEYYEMIEAKILQKHDITEINRLEAYTIMEQIKFRKGYSLRWYYWLKKSTQYHWMLFSNPMKELDSYTGLCSVPITHLNSYGDLFENQSRYTSINDKYSLTDNQKKNIAFVRVALGDHFNDLVQQGDVMLELLLKYKWRHFAKSRFILICCVHAIYYGSYCTGVLFAPELYGLNLEEDIFLEHPGQIVSITLMVFSLLVLVVQEFRQFYGSGNKLNYFFSGYNWIDMCAFVLPTFTLMQLCNNWPNFVQVCSISTLILWTQAILRLRVLSHFGVTLDIIIQLSKKIAPLLLIMLLVILAFTQSYIVLLRLEPDEYFRDTFSGVFVSKDGSATGDVTFEGNVEFATSSDNGFSNWLTAFYNVWLFIYGVWDPIVEEEAANSLMVMGLSALFSLIAVLIFFNLVIAIMSSVIEEVDSRGKKVWVSHFAGNI
ncbi:hypothetical protein INT48_004611 [Thamnidium elegans]|uniref:Ion transport domain-containing protein n=1 Tax=Thamnidium elegans TaxID=101142 RepID=A0A8H7SX09_9FUNG|nr:hypothetical protein INT48_004611 [Thamnidium elegans]